MPVHPAPITVTYSRGETPESMHRVIGVIADAQAVREGWGAIEAPVFPRSSLKPFQALAMMASGAADAYGLGPEQLALSMASHSGEPRHTERVMAWLEKLGLAESALHCGSHPPMYGKSADALIREGTEPSPRHHNCSGKHSGMLTLMHHLGAGPDYEDYGHPVQVAIRAMASRFLGVDLNAAPWGRDGCAVPNYAFPLRALAQGYARLTSPPEGLERFCERLLAAWAAHPDLVAGCERFDTAVMLASEGRILSKGGAEGVQAALIPGLGLGLAVKAEDGTQRAAEQAMAALMARLGALDLDNPELAKQWKPASRTITNARGDVIGRIRVDFS
jgi:L-asparaginase II